MVLDVGTERLSLPPETSMLLLLALPNTDFFPPHL